MAETTKITLSDQQSVTFDRTKNQESKISQLDMMKKLMELLNQLQDIQRMLTESSTEDLEQIAKFGQEMNKLADITQQASLENLNKTINTIDKEFNQQLAQKIFGGIVAGLMIIAGTAMCCTGNAGGVALFAMGIFSMIQTMAPKAVDKLIDDISDNNPKIALTLKSTIIVAATVIAAVAGGPAAALMTFAMMFSTLDPIQSAAAVWYMNNEGMNKDAANNAADDNTKLQTAIAITDATLMLIAVLALVGPTFTEDLSRLSNTVRNGAKNFFKSGKNIEIEMTDFSEKGKLKIENPSLEAPLVDSKPLDLTSPAQEPYSFQNRIRKFLEQFKNQLKLIESGAKIVSEGAQFADQVVSIFQGTTMINLAKIKKEMSTIQSCQVIQDELQNLISGMTKQTSDFIDNLQKNYRQSSQNYINKLFIDQVNFANMLANIA